MTRPAPPGAFGPPRFPGIDFDFDARGGLHRVRSFTALRLAAVPVAEPTPMLRTAIEREIATDPAIRIVAELFDVFRERDEPQCPIEWRFVTRILANSLDGLELNTAAAVLNAAEHCRVLLDSQRQELLDEAAKICDADWWQRAAESSGIECREPLAALISRIGIEATAVERVLAVGPSAAASVVLPYAPAATAGLFEQDTASSKTANS